MSSRDKKLEDEMLITHPSDTQRSMSGRDDSGRSGAGVSRIDRTALRRELAGAGSEEERRAIIQSIQERFGNDVAEEIVRDARVGRLPEETDGDTT